MCCVFLQGDSISSDDESNVPLATLQIPKGRNKRKRRTRASTRKRKTTARQLEEAHVAIAMEESLTEARQVEEEANRQHTLLTTAKDQSLAEAKKDEEEVKRHERRLDLVMKTNGYKRIPTDKDGDCFFNSVIAQLKYSVNNPGDTDLVQRLRQECCSHLEKYRTLYASWLEDTDSFQDLLIEIDKKGTWNSQIMDIIPYVLSSLLQCNILLFRSTKKSPFEKIMPVVQAQVLPQFIVPDTIALALSVVPGREHYDYAIPVKGKCKLNWYIVYYSMLYFGRKVIILMGI